MAINFTEPAEAKHIVWESFEVHVAGKSIRIRFTDANGDEYTYHTKPNMWNAALSFLFDDLANVAELKDRIETYLITNEIIDGTIVPD